MASFNVPSTRRPLPAGARVYNRFRGSKGIPRLPPSPLDLPYGSLRKPPCYRSPYSPGATRLGAQVDILAGKTSVES
jgi:hypothetical protein